MQRDLKSTLSPFRNSARGDGRRTERADSSYEWRAVSWSVRRGGTRTRGRSASTAPSSSSSGSSLPASATSPRPPSVVRDVVVEIEAPFNSGMLLIVGTLATDRVMERCPCMSRWLDRWRRSPALGSRLSKWGGCDTPPDLVPLDASASSLSSPSPLTAPYSAKWRWRFPSAIRPR
jgi:hypothetical protein